MIKALANTIRKQIVLCIWAMILALSPVFAQPAAYLDKVYSTPDLTQTDPRGSFADGGENFCAPVAVSNSFVWLSNNGYPKLLPSIKIPIGTIDRSFEFWREVDFNKDFKLTRIYEHHS